MVPKQARWRSFQTVVQVTGSGSIQFYSDGYTWNEVLFIGQSGAITGLTVHGILNLNDCAVCGFVINGIYGGYRSVVFDKNLYLCSNGLGLFLERGAIWEGDLSPSDTTTFITGNRANGVRATNGQLAFNPLFCSGNGANGIFLEKQAFLELDTITKSLASGQSNTVSNNTGYDLAVADDGLIVMTSTSALNLGSPNLQMNPDGSRIEITAPPPPTVTPFGPAPHAPSGS
jgi:hypothetical protein